MKPAVQAVLFDLDGTLVDSAPDLAGAVNDLLAEEGRPALPYERLRPLVGSGARGMVGAAFGLRPGDDGYEPRRVRFLELYAARSLRLTTVFDGVAHLLEGIEQAGLRWGIVTNKAHHLAHPIVHGLGLGDRAGVLIGGDTTPHAKPHPAPLLEAARRMGMGPAACVYVGDDLRDIQAGRAAGMAALAAAWGYLGNGEPVHDWQADAVIDQPRSLLNWLGLA
ncbi:MAG: phosphoglycolate phosphatase [Schleiferiaceae bacterium]